MDWSKTKTIFIVMFAILNVFLFSLYMNRMSALHLEEFGETRIEDRLRVDDITYGKLPEVKEASYVSGELKELSSADVSKLSEQRARVSDGHTLVSELKEPYSLKDNEGKWSFGDFLEKHVPNGKDYTLWEVDEDGRTATFFQKISGNPIYFNEKSTLTVQWNTDLEAVSYEQTMLHQLVEFKEEKTLYSPIQAINELYRSGHLLPGSDITEVELGYSALVQLTETQVFAPTWHIHVKLEDETTADHFVNAVDGKILNQLSAPVIEEQQ